MVRHMLKHSGEERKIKCQYCDYACYYPNRIKEHIKKMHSSQEQKEDQEVKIVKEKSVNLPLISAPIQSMPVMSMVSGADGRMFLIPNQSPVAIFNQTNPTTLLIQPTILSPQPVIQLSWPTSDANILLSNDNVKTKKVKGDILTSALLQSDILTEDKNK